MQINKIIASQKSVISSDKKLANTNIRNGNTDFFNLKPFIENDGILLIIKIPAITKTKAEKKGFKKTSF